MDQPLEGVDLLCQGSLQIIPLLSATLGFRNLGFSCRFCRRMCSGGGTDFSTCVLQPVPFHHFWLLVQVLLPQHHFHQLLVPVSFPCPASSSIFPSPLPSLSSTSDSLSPLHCSQTAFSFTMLPGSREKGQRGVGEH